MASERGRKTGKVDSRFFQRKASSGRPVEASRNGPGRAAARGSGAPPLCARGDVRRTGVCVGRDRHRRFCGDCQGFRNNLRNLRSLVRAGFAHSPIAFSAVSESQAAKSSSDKCSAAVEAPGLWSARLFACTCCCGMLARSSFHPSRTGGPRSSKPGNRRPMRRIRSGCWIVNLIARGMIAAKFAWS